MGCFRFGWKCTYVLSTRWRERVGSVTMWHPTPYPYLSWQSEYTDCIFTKYAIKKSVGLCNIIHLRQTQRKPSCTISCMYKQCILISAYQRSNFNVSSLLTIPNMTIFGIVEICGMYKYTVFLECYPDIPRYFIHIIHKYGMFILLFLPLCVLLNQLICGRFVC